MYDIDELKEKIIMQLETEAYYFPSAIAEICEVERMDDEQIIRKAKELHII